MYERRIQEAWRNLKGYTISLGGIWVLNKNGVQKFRQNREGYPPIESMKEDIRAAAAAEAKAAAIAKVKAHFKIVLSNIECVGKTKAQPVLQKLWGKSAK